MAWGRSLREIVLSGTFKIKSTASKLQNGNEQAIFAILMIFTFSCVLLCDQNILEIHKMHLKST